MSTLSTTRNYQDTVDLTEAQLDSAFDSVETWANGNIGSTNITTGGVEAANIASSAVTASKLASDAVTTAKILDANVTGAKLASTIVDNSTIAISSSQLIVKDAGITRAKLAAVGQQLSSSSGNFTTASTSYVSVTNLSVTFTSTGRPAILFLQPDGSGNTSYIDSGVGLLTLSFRNNTTSTDIAEFIFNGANTNWYMPTLQIMDVPSAGSVNYIIRAKVSAGTGKVQYLKLAGYELA